MGRRESSQGGVACGLPAGRSGTARSIPIFSEVLGSEGVVHLEGKVTYNENDIPPTPEYTDKCIILLQSVKDSLPFLDWLI